MKEKREIQFKFFAGNPHKGQWAGVHYYSPQVQAIYEHRGDIAAVLSLSGPANFDSTKAGNLLIDFLHETYFESEAESSLEALREAVNKVKECLLDFMVNDEVSSETGVEISLIACAIQEEFLYIAQLGEARVYGYRDSEMVDFTEYVKDPTGKGEIKLGSTILQEDDRLLIVTAETDFNLSPIEKKHVLEGFKLDSVEAKLFSNESLISALLLGYELMPSVEESSEPDADIHYSKPEEEELEDQVYQQKVASNLEPEIVELKSKNIIKLDLNKVGNNLNRLKRDRRTKTFLYLLSCAGVGIINFIVKICKFFWTRILKMDGEMYVRGGGRRNMNWRPFILLAIILIVAGVLIIRTIRERKETAERELQNKQAIEKVENDINIFSSDIDVLVRTVGQEPEKTSGLNKIQQMKDELENVNLPVYEQKKSELKGKLDTFENKLYRKIDASQPKIVKDFGIYEGSGPEDFVFNNGMIYVADKEGNKILAMDTDGNKLKGLGENLQSPRAIDIFEGSEVVFLDENEERGIGTINLENSQLERLPGLSSNRLGNIKEMKIYEVSATDKRLYAVRANTKEVIQLRRGTNSFGLPELRMTRTDFGELLDLDINAGRIYVLSQGQGLRRFSGDNEFNNDVKGMLNGDSWDTADSLAVDNKYIYLGDSAKKRILVFNDTRKSDLIEIDFIAQYDLSKVEGAENIKEISSDISKNKLYVLANTKLMELDLNLLKEFTY